MRVLTVTLIWIASLLLANAEGAFKQLASLDHYGVIGHWPFSEGTGSQAFDISGGGNTVSLAGSSPPTWTTGPFGHALNFIGTNCYATAANVNPVKMSVSLWIFPKALSQNWQGLINTKAAASGGTGFALSYLDTRQFTFKMANGDCVSTAHATNAWYHIVGVFDGTNTVVYVNGVNEGSLPDVFGSTSTRITIGFWNSSWSTYAQYFTGKMSDILIFSRALSAIEILNLYCQGGGRTP